MYLFILRNMNSTFKSNFVHKYRFTHVFGSQYFIINKIFITFWFKKYNQNSDLPKYTQGDQLVTLWSRNSYKTFIKHFGKRFLED